MEIFGVEFESWNVVLLRLNWFAIILLLVIIFVVSWIYSVVKYSLQGTTQGRYLTGGVPPVRFSM